MFEPDFVDFFNLLNKCEVDYLVVGAHALAYHGRPRHTGQLDIWIRQSKVNASKMVTVINELGLLPWV